MVGSNYLATSIMTPLIKLAKKVSKTGVFSRSDILEIINRYIYIIIYRNIQKIKLDIFQTKVKLCISIHR